MDCGVMTVGCSSDYLKKLATTGCDSLAPQHKHLFAHNVALAEDPLTTEGSTKASNTIFTNPAEDCSTNMNKIRRKSTPKKERK